MADALASGTNADFWMDCPKTLYLWGLLGKLIFRFYENVCQKYKGRADENIKCGCGGMADTLASGASLSQSGEGSSPFSRITKVAHRAAFVVFESSGFSADFCRQNAGLKN